MIEYPGSEYPPINPATGRAHLQSCSVWWRKENHEAKLHEWCGRCTCTLGEGKP